MTREAPNAHLDRDKAARLTARLGLVPQSRARYAHGLDRNARRRLAVAATGDGKGCAEPEDEQANPSNAEQGRRLEGVGACPWVPAADGERGRRRAHKRPVDIAVARRKGVGCFGLLQATCAMEAG